MVISEIIVSTKKETIVGDYEYGADTISGVIICFAHIE
jgi:hypothetical protein